MFSISNHQRFYLYSEATDMRKGFDGLSGLVRNVMGQDPLNGWVFIFVNRRRNRMKLLVWESGGFVLYYKLLEKGTFELPQPQQPHTTHCHISWQQLVLIVEGVSLQSVHHRKRYVR